MLRLLVLGVLPLLNSAPVSAADRSAEDFFEQRVRPVLAAKCLQCHGDESPEAGLRLTSREEILRGGQSGPAAIAGESAESLLIAAIGRAGTLKMPPTGKLDEQEVAALTEWVELGLPWPAATGPLRAGQGEMVVTDADREHWSFRPIGDPPLPDVQHAEWPQSSLDHFVLNTLEEAGLEPSSPADRRTLLRRAYYGLIGLPPTPAQMQEFLDDPRPTSAALEKVIDELLASPRYGERWGRHWLDVARFADTKDGVLMYGDDRIRPYAYTYRDYVIRALNEDLPFDRFIEEQLAADLIEPEVEPWRLAALGFLTLGRMYDNNVHDVIDDQIDTVTQGFLGLTVSCARCHDHKYDPVPTADYYSLYGVFASSEKPLVPPLIESPEAIPGAEEFEEQIAPKRAELQQFLDEQFALLSETARQRTGDYLVHVATTEPDPLETAIFFLSLAPEDLRPPIVARWRRLVSERANSDDPVFGPWHDLMQLPESEEADDAPAFSVRAAAIIERWHRRPAGIAPGELNPLVLEALAEASLNSRADVARAYGDLLVRLYEESKTEAEEADGADRPEPRDEARRQLLELVVSRESPAYFPKSQTRRYMSRGETDAFGGKLKELDRMAVQSPHAPPRAMVVYDTEEPHDPRIFVRGNPSQPGRRVPRQFLSLLSSDEREPFGQGSGRLELARAIASPENPLTARVIVNRVWMHHFGAPLVSTPNDFGTRSTPPAHPELLDHLATKFMNGGWSLKRLHRELLLSSTYQQVSSVPPSAAGFQVDPENRLLWRMNRQRLDFEAMRDTLLVLANHLDDRLEGRPVEIAHDPQSRVRTVYGLVDRQSLPGVFRAFDFASPDVSVGRRPRTMVAQQALFALNSPFMLERAKGVAARPEVAGISEAEQRVAVLYQTVLLREPDAEELAAALEFVDTQPDEESELTVWEQLAHVLLSSNELMYLD